MIKDEEVRVTSKTGGMKGRKAARFGGADPLALMELAKVYGMGEEKYDRFNYLKGYEWSLSIDALFRHLFAFLSGEDRDPESGLLHTAHAAWHCLTLTSFQLRQVGEDDRAPALDELDLNTLDVNSSTFYNARQDPAKREILSALDRQFTQLGFTPLCGATYGTHWCEYPIGHDGPHRDAEAGYFNTTQYWGAENNPWGDV